MKPEHRRAVNACAAAVLAFACMCGPANKPEEPADLQLLTPKGGETYRVGQSVTVTWKASAKVVSVYFKVSTDNGATWDESAVKGSIAADSGTWVWKVGSEYFPVSPAYPSSKCLLKVLDYETLGQTYSAVSGAFAVQPGPVEITYPTGGETFKKGDTVTIAWKVNSTVTSVLFQVSTDGGATWNTCINQDGVAVDASAGSYKWVVGGEFYDVSPAYPSNNVKIKIFELNNESRCSIESAVFAVTL